MLKTNYIEILKLEDEQVLKIATFSVSKSEGWTTFLSSDFKAPSRKGDRKRGNARGGRRTWRKYGPINHHDQSSYKNFQRLRHYVQNLYRSIAGGFQVSVFSGISKCEKWVFSSWVYFWAIFLLFVFMNSKVLILILSYILYNINYTTLLSFEIQFVF